MSSEQGLDVVGVGGGSAVVVSYQVGAVVEV